MINETLKKIIKKNFPPLEIAIAYGSAVFPQKNNVGKMTDLMFLVNNSKEFHKQNLIMNPQHYSAISSFLKEEFIAKVNNFGTGMYFNPMIHVDDVYLKYGVIEINTAIKLMEEWNNLFFSGRLHKPVLKLYPFNDNTKEVFEAHCERNIERAFSLCVLKLPNIINQIDIYREIVQLTYLGDVRTKLKAETANKIDNIVQGGLNNFIDLYKGVMIKYKKRDALCEINGLITINNENNQIYLNNLSSSFLRSMYIYTLKNHIEYRKYDQNAFYNDIFLKMDSSMRKEIIDSYIIKLNYKSSINGIFSGMISTDPHKSFLYVLEKYKKSLLK